jgi:transitional endoplasmic reticulum ATPase
MRSLASRSTLISILYVKSLGKSCDQDDIRSIFEKAREIDLCLLVFEDIDSLMSDDVKSFFLNEVNGLKGNDDIMMVGSINYCVFIPQRSLE